MSKAMSDGLKDSDDKETEQGNQRDLVSFKQCNRRGLFKQRTPEGVGNKAREGDVDEKSTTTTGADSNLGYHESHQGDC